MATKVATHKRYYDKVEFKTSGLQKVLVGCGETGASLANRSRRQMIIIDRDKKAFKRLTNPEKHILITAEATSEEALSAISKASTLILAFSDQAVSTYVGLLAKLKYGVSRVFVLADEETVALKKLKLKAFSKDTINRI